MTDEKGMKGWLAVMEGDETTPGLAKWTDSLLRGTEQIGTLNPDIKHSKDNLIEASFSINKSIMKLPYKVDDHEPINLSVDLMSYHNIWNDNAETILSISSELISLRNQREDSESLAILRILITHRPQVSMQSEAGRKIDLNPHQRTWLELLAQAPFIYFGRNMFSTDLINFKIEVNINNPDEFLPTDFLHRITRKNFNEDKFPPIFDHQLDRHGGCPALHSKYKNLNLINRLGLIYYKALCQWYEEKYGANALAETTSTKVRKVSKCPHKS